MISPGWHPRETIVVTEEPHPQKENSTYMATQAQMKANAANARKSTGPTSPAGKAKSCLNRVSHGFNSATIFIALEEKEEFDALLSDLVNQFRPFNPNEQILVEKMVHNHWLSLRAIRLQSLVLKGSVPHGFIHKDLGLLIRYQAAADRAYHKAHSELLKAQKEREKSGIGFEPEKAEAPSECAAASPQEPPAAAKKPAAENPVEPDFVALAVELADIMDLSVAEVARAA